MTWYAIVIHIDVKLIYLVNNKYRYINLRVRVCVRVMCACVRVRAMCACVRVRVRVCVS